jgi:hypothetical protein
MGSTYFIKAGYLEISMRTFDQNKTELVNSLVNSDLALHADQL